MLARSTRMWRLRIVDSVVAVAVAMILAGGADMSMANEREGGGAASGDVEELLVQLDINQQGLDDTVLLLKGSGGELYAAEDDLKRWRLRVPTSQPIIHKDVTFYSLSIDGLTYEVDESRSTVLVTAPPQAFVATELDDANKRAVPAAKPGIGGFVNYDLFAERSSGITRKSGLFELGLFSGLGVGTGSFVVNDGEPLQRRFTRLETTWTLDRPETLSTLRIGDSISQPGMWGRSVRFGGLQYGTNFAVQPGLSTLPLQSVSGQAVLPSSVDVYVNNVLSSRKDIAPGPFSITNVPVVTGQGDVRVVVRDVLGREQVINQPFYVSASLLNAGLHDYSYELGAVRRNFGIDSNDYGQPFFSGTHRLGLTDRLTGELRAEIQAQHQTVGVGAAWLLPSLGILSGAVAASHSRAGTGALVAAGLERQASPVSFGAHVQMASARFAQLGFDADNPPPRCVANANVGMAMPGGGSLGLAYVYLDNRGSATTQTDGRFQLVSASYGTQLGRLGFLSLSVSKSLRGGGDTLVGANWTLPLGQRSTTSVSVTRQGGHTDALAQLQQGLPAGTGFGYLLEQGQRGTRDASVSAQNGIGTYDIEAASSQGKTGVRVSASGGIALLHGVHLARRITDSFALVDLPEFPNVRVYADNQLVGRTDAKGQMLLPRLRAYEKNPISIEQMDLPFDAKVGTLSIDAVPYYRSGMLVQFPITHAHDALLTIDLEDGTPLPAGAMVKLGDQAQEFPVGRDGEVYLTGLSAQNRLRASWRDQSCDIAVPFAATGDPLPHLGSFVCKGVLQ
jgi:outer membrane usher protein